MKKIIFVLLTLTLFAKAAHACPAPSEEVEIKDGEKVAFFNNDYTKQTLSNVQATSTTNRTIKSVLDNGRDNEIVIIQGVLTQQVDDDEFIITDNTGSIKLDIDDDILRQLGIPFLTVNTEVKVQAVVDNEILEMINLDAIRVRVIGQMAHDNF